MVQLVQFELLFINYSFFYLDCVPHARFYLVCPGSVRMQQSARGRPCVSLLEANEVTSIPRLSKRFNKTEIPPWKATWALDVGPRKRCGNSQALLR